MSSISGVSLNQPVIRLLNTNNPKPDPVQEQAEIIADLVSGQVEKYSSDIHQHEFNNLPNQTSPVDYAELQADSIYRNLQNPEQASTEFLTQQLAQDAEEQDSVIKTTSDDTETEDTEHSYSKAVKAFKEYMEKTPEERYFEDFLESKDMTEEEFKALTPEEKQDLLAEFKDYVKQRFGVANNSNSASNTSITA